MSILQFFDFFLPGEFLYRLHHSNTLVLLLVSIVYLLTFENESKPVNILFAVLYLSLLREGHRGTQMSYVLQFFHEHRIFVFILIFRLLIFYTVSWFALIIHHFEYSSSNLVTT